MRSAADSDYRPTRSGSPPVAPAQGFDFLRDVLPVHVVIDRFARGNTAQQIGLALTPQEQIGVVVAHATHLQSRGRSKELITLFETAAHRPTRRSQPLSRPQ